VQRSHQNRFLGQINIRSPVSHNIGNPTELAATTGHPAAIASSSTNPSVSVREGKINASAEAKAAPNSLPVRYPTK